MMTITHSQLQGFTVAEGSTITPEELAQAGFNLKNFRFFPACFEKATTALHDFLVIDESIGNKRIYRFERLPY